MEAEQLEKITNDELMGLLAAARQLDADAKAYQAETIDQVKATPAYQRAESDRVQSGELMIQLETEIKARAVAAFDGENKKPWPGVSIIDKTIVKLLDEAKARKYVLESAPSRVKIDFSGLDKLAAKLNGTALQFDFYEISKKPTAQIASDLSAYALSEEE